MCSAESTAEVWECASVQCYMSQRLYFNERERERETNYKCTKFRSFWKIVTKYLCLSVANNSKFKLLYWKCEISCLETSVYKFFFLADKWQKTCLSLNQIDFMCYIKSIFYDTSKKVIFNFLQKTLSSNNFSIYRFVAFLKFVVILESITILCFFTDIHNMLFFFC